MLFINFIKQTNKNKNFLTKTIIFISFSLIFLNINSKFLEGNLNEKGNLNFKEKISDIENAISITNNINAPELTIHVVPHTHDDAGWNWTFDEYYYGSGTCKVSVKKILDNFVNSLYERKDRTFIYVETGFFVRWYKEQTAEIKEKVKNLLKEKRFEFINGGYVMHDEAASYYQHNIDQMRLGLLFLKEEFDFVPEIAWFIDPFGHSASNAYILSKMGFKKIAIVRIDYSDKEQRKKNKSLEFYWVPFNKFDDSVKIFTHVAYEHYGPPRSIDSFEQDKPKKLNTLEKFFYANRFVKEMREHSKAYIHNHIMIMFGNDFTFNKQGVNYENLESVMDFINEWKILGYKTNVKYSLPSIYFDSIFKDVENWPAYKNDDFFPYADSSDSIWTGYFTSRPYLKGVVRDAGNYLNAVSKILFKFIFRFNINPEWKKDSKKKEIIDEAISKLFTLREKLAICQHHDAVAGTATEIVSQDYINMLEDAVNDSKKNYQKFVEKFFSHSQNESSRNYICIDPVVDYKCLEKQLGDLNAENEKLLIRITQDENYKLRFNNINNINSTDSNNSNNNTDSENLFNSFEINENNEIQKNENETISSEIDTFCINDLRNKTQNCKVYFKNQRKFLVKKKTNSRNSTSNSTNLKYINDNTDEDFVEENLKVYFSDIHNEKKKELTENISLFYENEKEENSNKENKGSLKFQISTKLNTYNFTVYHAFYESYNGENSNLREKNSCPSGAYILSSTKVDFDKFELLHDKSYFEKGNLVSRVVLRFEKSYLILTMDNQNPKGYIEMESIWDPIPDDAKALEYLLVVDSDMDNEINLPSGKKEPEFWTDSNGIKMMRRIKDFRTGYDFHVEDPVSANFYPVNSMFSIREKTSNSINYSINEYEGLTNENKMISYMVDRSESIGALKKGQFIVIQNRQSYTDDRKGMADGLLKEASSFKINFKIKSYLVFDNNPNLIKQIENKIQNRFALFTSIVNINYKKTKKDNNKNTKKYINTAKKGKGIEYQKRFLNEFSKNFSTSSNGNKNLIMNVHILNNNKVYLQFFNNCDLFHENNCLAQEINLIEKDGLKFTEYAFNGTTPLNKDFIKQKSISMKINPFDFKLFLIEFTEIDD